MKRRSFLKMSLSGAGSLVISNYVSANFGDLFPFFAPVDVANPLAQYPNRDWEKTYRNLWHYDSEFTFLCAPNDTHNCLLKAHVKNDVIVRLAPSFGFSKAEDIYKNKASARWEPRCCQKGLALPRRIYGDRRIKYPMVREGFLQWFYDGFPRGEDGKPPAKYFAGRGKEAFLKISWEAAFNIAARAMQNIAETYSGDAGKEKLLKQGYDPLMVEATDGAGVQTLKFRGGMSGLGMTRIMGHYRMANMMALLDSKIRNLPPDKAKGARGWDNYAWHTDLPPGHPMVTGQQTVDWDLVCVEHSKHIIVWGMNWITTKMPDAHWLTEARLRGAKVTVIACEYSATCNKGDNVLIVRPGTTPALALGFCNVIIREKLYDADYLKKFTDLPFLVRTDNYKFLKPQDVFAEYKPAELKNYITTIKEGEKLKPELKQKQPIITDKLRQEWGDFMVWEEKSGKPVVVNRDDIGKSLSGKDAEGGVSDSALEGKFRIQLNDGKEVEVVPVFELIKNYILDNYDPQTVSEITWAPWEGIEAIAREVGKNPGSTLFAIGMGPNQFFNNDLKDRTVLLLASLTKNIGRIGGNVGSYAGNYRSAFLDGVTEYIAENPFNIQLDEKGHVETKYCYKPESVHYFNLGDRILRGGDKVLTGKSHMPAPSKSIMVANSNSLIGNAKGHYDNVVNLYPHVEFIGINEWWWTTSCEYADLVFAVDSWAEFKSPDATISVTNPFLYIFPRTPMQRVFDTRGDIEVAAGIANAFAEITGDNRFRDYFKFVNEGKPEVYLQRMLESSGATKGYNIKDLEKNASQGIPALLMSRTYPKFVGYEQTEENKPWYTKSGRLEFYRDEDEFMNAGENLPVFREPIDSTFYEPNVIVAKPNPAIRPLTPDKMGFSADDLSSDMRQARNVVKSWGEVKNTRHPLTKQDPKYKFVFHTPKYRHGAHTTPVDTDVVAVWFGPFGDIYRHDKRMPYITEMYVDINPLDAKELELEDGDYAYIDADPGDRPFRNFEEKKESEEYKVARLMCRIRYYPGTPRGVLRMWHNVYASTFGSVAGAKKDPTGMAKNPATRYQALFRYGSQQSCTRAWLKPTLMTESLVRKNLYGQQIGKGFMLDVHSPTGAPRESFVKVEFAENGGIAPNRIWRPAELKIRPTYEDEKFKTYLAGGYLKK